MSDEAVKDIFPSGATYPFTLSDFNFFARDPSLWDRITGVGDWWHDWGGDGTATVDLLSGDIEVRGFFLSLINSEAHEEDEDFYPDYSDDDFHKEPFRAVGHTPTDLKHYLNAGYLTAVVNFSGGGDEGDVTDVIFHHADGHIVTVTGEGKITVSLASDP